MNQNIFAETETAKPTTLKPRTAEGGELTSLTETTPCYVCSLLNFSKP